MWEAEGSVDRYVIPADHKWARNAAVAAIVRETLEAMDPAVSQTHLEPEGFPGGVIDVAALPPQDLDAEGCERFLVCEEWHGLGGAPPR